MQRFDCLARDCPIFGPHLLEASAGTGKTFSIEHIFVRLILESIDVEQILAVTFTRAAARELKSRIRANLEKALQFISSKEPVWDYLVPFFDSEDAVRLLSDALAAFDRCQIFTIHGFCYRILKEFAFEAKIGAISDPNEGRKIPEKLRQAALDFLENGVDPELLCSEQLTLLLKQFDSHEDLIDRLLKLDEGGPTDSFSEICAKCKAALHHWNLEETKLFEDFFALQKGYKAEIKGDFESQIKGLVNPNFFPKLLKERGSLFDFFSPENRKVKAQDPTFLHYPGFFDWARVHIAPLMKQKILPVLQAAWNPIAKKILANEEHLDPDEILLKMKNAVEDENFARSIRGKYAAAVIDEFQDTDAVQWDIFQKLFFADHSLSIRALYLVGDPKQAIYRFRNADVYTYLKARDYLGEKHLYQLDTNFRSSKRMISALNSLFDRNWLHLPKAKRSLPYHAVRAGASIESNFGDEKGALHFVVSEGEPSLLFDEVLIPYAANEIQKLALNKCAILVKDRYQAERALEYLRKMGIAAVAKSHTPLGQTVAFRAICELIEAVLSPRDQSAAKIVMAGPFANPDLSFPELKVLLEERGLVPFARRFRLDADAMQIFEHLFAWEKKEGFSFEGLKRTLNQLRDLDADEGAARRMEVNEEAVQIMTMHISKGLEFDVVFALGLIARTPESDEVEESDAEKLRQFYVAMTRAKKRLYIPIIVSNKEPAPGTHSPIELFSRHFSGPILNELTSLAKVESITVEACSSTSSIPNGAQISSQVQDVPESITKLKSDRQEQIFPSFSPSFLTSFTSLAIPHVNPYGTFHADENLNQSIPRVTQSPELLRQSESQILNHVEYTMQTLPRGSETGIIIHRVFEKLFSSPSPIWRIPHAVDKLVDEQLISTPLAPWKVAVQQMVRQIITLPMQTDEEFFTLSEIDRCQVEMEFVFLNTPNFIKGFIDLVFYYRDKVYFLDWKTNWLEDYSQPQLEAVMKANEYPLQASIYEEAIKRHFKIEFGGAYYLFVRGGAYYRI